MRWEMVETVKDPPPLRFEELPAEAQRKLLDKWDREDVAIRNAARREALALRQGAIVGCVSALLFLPLIAVVPAWIYPCWGGLGAWLGRRVVAREHSQLGGVGTFGGGLILASLAAHLFRFVALFEPVSLGSALRIRFMFAWIFWAGAGAIIGFLAEQRRQETGIC